MSKKVERAQTAHDAAVQRMHDANAAIQALKKDAEEAEVKSAEEAFATALAEVERTKANLDEARSQAEAKDTRKKALTDYPLPEVPAEKAEGGAATVGEAQLRDQRRSPTDGRRPAGESRVGKEEMTYDRHKEASYFADLLQGQKYNDPGALERLMRHRQEMFLHLRQERGLRQFRAINETSGTGGEFVPPLWLNEQYIHFLRAARATADVVNHMPLPEHTNTINFPQITGGTSVAAQADGGTVSSTDITTSSLAVPVKTAAGQQDLARQLLERSVPGMDQVLFQDLVAAYNATLDTQVISGSGSGANATGILNTSSIQTETYTQTTPAFGGAGGMAAKTAEGINKVATNRFLPPDVIIMHPRRWFWIVSQSDSQNRPLVVPQGDSFNAIGVQDRVVAQARAGSIVGLPVVIDPNIPTNLGAGTNEDRVIIMRVADSWLMEDSAGPYTRVYEEVLSGNLQIRVQLYNYYAFTAGRYASSVCVMSGTGLVTPSF